MEEEQVEQHEATDGIILTDWGWNDRCAPGETGHENCERVVLGDLLPRRPVRIREKIRLQPMDNIVNTQQPFAVTTLLLLAIFQSVCRSDLRSLVLVFLRDANSEWRNVLMLWRHFANEHFRWSRRNPPLMKEEDWTHVVSVRRKCKVAEAALGQHLVRPAHLPEFRNFDWQYIDYTASAEVRRTTEEFCSRHHRFLQTAINIQRHELFYGRQPALRATANIMIMGDSFNEQLKRKGLFVDGMAANFGAHDWGVIQIGTEVQQIITTTGKGYIMLNNNLTDEEFRKKSIDDTAHLLTNFEYRSRGVLVTLPPYVHSHPTKWGILKNVFVVTARRFNFGMLEPRFSQNNAYPLFVNEVGEPTAKGILDYIGTLRAAIPGFPLKEEELGPIAAQDDQPPTPFRLPTPPPPPPAPPVERPTTKKRSRLDVPPEVEKEVGLSSHSYRSFKRNNNTNTKRSLIFQNRNLGGANGSGIVGPSKSLGPNRERTMAGSAGPSTTNDTGRVRVFEKIVNNRSLSLQDRTMAGRWGPSTPPNVGRVRVFEESLNDRSCSFQDRTSKENRGPQAFQNVNRDGTWDIDFMEQSTSQPVDRVRVFKRKLSENDRSFNFQNRPPQQNWDENMAETSTNAFGECWRDSVTQRGNPELIPKYISAAIIGNQVDKLSQQIEDYYEFHQQIDEETERKQRVFKIIKDAIKERKVWYPELTTASVTGSSSTQLAAFESDLDLTFATTKPLSVEKKLEILRGLQHVFGRREFDFYNIDVIPSNRVPVLEMKYMEKGRRRPTLNIDITVGNDNASTHTTLINNWTANDPRFIPLAFFSKAWVKHIGANNSRNEGFNSISITFLLGYYLMKEEVLPKEANSNFVSKNNNSLGQLFVGFLQFLHQFDFQTTAISILHGVAFPKKLTGNNNRYEVVILDPSSVGPIEYASNTARCVRSGGLTKLSMALGKLQRLQEDEINFESLFQVPLRPRRIKRVWSRVTTSALLTVVSLLGFLSVTYAEPLGKEQNENGVDIIGLIGMILVVGKLFGFKALKSLIFLFPHFVGGTSLADIPGRALLCSKIKSYWRVPTVSCADIKNTSPGKNVTLDIFDKVRLPYRVSGSYACRKFRDTVELYQNMLGDKFPEERREYLPISSEECRRMRKKKECQVGKLIGNGRVLRTLNVIKAEYPGKWSSWWNGPRNYTTENCELVSTDLFRMGTKSMSSPILDVQHCNYEDGFCNLNDSLLVWQVECRTPGCEPCSYKYGWSWFGKAWKNEFLEESGENSLTWS
ncbi:unnamed protein product [Meloidogyne enterolobii]|uniref:Uncharacterized protein n=1 Tax=Meloidogyne enterolobii TaxID=390850 RepID=A0ACB1A3W8_MELEN